MPAPRFDISDDMTRLEQKIVHKTEHDRQNGVARLFFVDGSFVEFEIQTHAMTSYPQLVITLDGGSSS